MKVNIWLSVLFAAITLGIGYYLNKLANAKSNEMLLAELKKELAALQIQQATSRTSGEVVEIEKQKAQVQSQIQLLEQLQLTV